jgi:hypothetical protein
MFRRLLLDPTPTDGGGNTPPPAAPPATPPPATPPATPPPAADPNDTLRRERDQARQERDALRGKVPGDGAVVLTGDDAAAWAAFQALGHKPAEIKTKLGERDTFEGRIKAADREKLIGSAAKVHGFDPDVLADKAGADLRIEIADVQRNGKTVKVAQVVTIEKKDGKDVEVRTDLDKHAEKHWAKYLPVLRAAKPDLSTPGRTTPRTVTPPSDEKKIPRRNLVR